MQKETQDAMPVCGDFDLQSREGHLALDCAAANKNILPVSLVSIGYPAEKYPLDDMYDPARVRTDHW